MVSNATDGGTGELLRLAKGTPVPGESIHLSTHPAVDGNLLKLGFNLFATANNHALDYGIEGLRRQLTTLSELGMVHAGIGVIISAPELSYQAV